MRYICPSWRFFWRLFLALISGAFFVFACVLAESCLKTDKLKTRQACLKLEPVTSSAERFYPQNTTKMPTLLEIASRVEAAVEAYQSVRDLTEREVWKEKLRLENVGAHHSYTQRFDHPLYLI